MGCDFDILVQVLHGSCWISILNLRTKTRCGGYPLCDAVRNYVSSSGVTGKYGVEFPILRRSVSHKDVIIFSKAVTSNDLFGGPIETVIEEGKIEEEDDETCVNSSESIIERQERSECHFEIKYETNFVYFSKSQFSDMLLHIENYKDYKPLLEQILPYCDLALSALKPREERGYSYNSQYFLCSQQAGIDRITSDLLRAQAQDLFTQSLRQILVTKVPAVLIDIIAEYALPVGKDVRVAWTDEEDQSKSIRTGYYL